MTDYLRLIAAVCCTVAPFLLIYANLPVRDHLGNRQWVLTGGDWFVRLSTYGLTWTLAYGFWEAQVHGAPIAARTWIVAIASVEVFVAGLIQAAARWRAARPGP